jgi:anti-anti-sigma regulatory factor/PAS domain-containing protein
VIPVWVYDHGTFRFRWANEAALVVWRAATLEEFLSRDLSDLSASTRTRLDNYLLTLQNGGTVIEDWTLYPHGKPTTMTLHGSSVELDDGRLAILFQAVLKEKPIDPSMIRAAESLRHTSLMVSLAKENGEVVFHNPAALRAFGNAESITAWFDDGAEALLATIRQGDVFQGEIPVKALQGVRWHSLRATPTVDPVTGDRSVLVQQLDIDKRRLAEDLAESRRLAVDELNRTLSLVEQQRRQILALSAPILELGEKTLAVPIIGSLSNERMSEIAERLLPSVQSQHCRFIILDLTGCSELDEAGALSLSRLISAIELLGARPIITGIHPLLARAMLTARLELARLQTLRTLRDGIEHCRQSVSRLQAAAKDSKQRGMTSV